MTVSKRDYGQGVSIHEYSRDVGTGIVAVDDAAFAWLRASHPQRPWLLSNRRYKISQPVNMTGIQNQHLIGMGAENSCVIEQTNLDASIVLYGNARHQVLESVRLEHTTRSNPGTAGIEAVGFTALGTIRDVQVWWSSNGFLMTGAGRVFFSQSIDTLECRGFSEWGANFDTDPNRGSTGNNIENLYINNSTNGVAPFDACIGGLRIAQSTQSNWNQINIEAMQASGMPVTIVQSANQVFNALHFEQVTIPGPEHGLIEMSGFRTCGHFTGLEVFRCFGADSSIFYMSPNTHAVVDMSETFNNEQINWIVDGPFLGNDATIEIEDHKDIVTNAGNLLTGVHRPNFDDRCVTRYNRDWLTLEEGGQRYRIEMVGGALTATPV